MLLRFALAAAALALAAPIASAQAFDPAHPPAGYYVHQKVVYQNDGGAPNDRDYLLRELRHISAHVAATKGDVEISVVSFAAGVPVFVTAKKDAELAKALDQARAAHVRFLICNNTMQGMHLKPGDLYGVTDADIVPSGVAELARLQGQGFVYIHP